MFGLNKTTSKFCDLKGKVAIITGAAKGMGKADAIKLAQAGAKVVLCDIDTAGCQLVVEEIKKIRGEAIVVKCDISKKADIDNVVAETLKKFGKIDVLVNNAGIYPSEPFLQMSEQNFAKVIDVNLKGSFLCAQQALLSMLRKPKVSEASTGQASYIINITSVVGIRGNPGQANYAASKAGLIGLTKTLAHEYASRNVLVNAIAPGFITTPMTDTLPPAIKDKALAHIPLNRFDSYRCRTLPHTLNERHSGVLILSSSNSSSNANR
jgi:3-oxoacyl-[acyl-carrier protein] reductase